MSARPATRKFNLTMKGYHAAWFFEQEEALAARPANATAACATCDTVYPSAGLKPLDSDYTYEQAAKDISFERDGKLCPACRARFMAEYGVKANDVYSVYDLGNDRND